MEAFFWVVVSRGSGWNGDFNTAFTEGTEVRKKGSKAKGEETARGGWRRGAEIRSRMSSDYQTI